MRIISQDKMTDVSYDGAVIYIDARTDNQICVIAWMPLPEPARLEND